MFLQTGEWFYYSKFPSLLGMGIQGVRQEESYLHFSIVVFKSLFSIIANMRNSFVLAPFQGAIWG